MKRIIFTAIGGIVQQGFVSIESEKTIAAASRTMSLAEIAELE